VTTYAIVRATADHLRDLGSRLREQDILELRVQGAEFNDEAIRVLVSRDTWVGMADGRPVVAFGALPSSILGGAASLWLLATPDLYPHSRTFIRSARPVLAALGRAYPQLTSIVVASNVVAIRWLQWLGFTIGDQPYAQGVNGEPILPCYYKG